jgi:dTDP-4-amino-4,6-dideoxygalactose transaminase
MAGGRLAGTYGRVGAFSFYATKTITTGEGGMLVTADPDVADRARLM